MSDATHSARTLATCSKTPLRGTLLRGSLIVILVVAGVWFLYCRSLPKYRGKARFYCSHTSVELSVHDSGRIKRLNWHSAPGNAASYMSGSRLAPDDIQRNHYEIDFILLVRLSDWTVKSPIWIEQISPKRESIFDLLPRSRPVASGVELRIPYIPPSDNIEIPADNKIRELILLLSAEDDNTGWRVLFFDDGDLADVYRKGIVIPDLLSLPRFESWPDRSEYENAWKAAKDELGVVSYRGANDGLGP